MPGIPEGLGRRHPRASLVAAALALVLAPASAAGAPPGAGAAPDPAHRVKAAFVYQFMRFIDWPADTTTAPGRAWQIAVLEDSMFFRELERVVAGRTVHDRPVQPRLVRRIEDAAPCHVLYVGTESAERIGQAVASFGSRPVLTVGSAAVFTRSGGVLRFYVAEDRVRFEVNVDAARRTRLSISSKLLGLASIYSEAGGKAAP